MQSTLSKATLGRLPMYLQFIRRMSAEKVSATQIAKGLGLGEVQVRKDLASVCAAGLPKVGYPVAALRRDMEKALKTSAPTCAIVVGAGKLGSALMEYEGFGEYGMEIIAAFDKNAAASPFVSWSPRSMEKSCRVAKSLTLLLMNEAYGSSRGAAVLETVPTCMLSIISPA